MANFGWTELEAENKRLKAEVVELRAWQLEVAEGMGYVNWAEGQGGYEVAAPGVILEAWRKSRTSDYENIDLRADLETAARVVWEAEKRANALFSGAAACEATLAGVRDALDRVTRERDELKARLFMPGEK